MTATVNRGRLLLRAELELESERVIAHTLEMSSSGAFVQTDLRPPLGTALRVHLSFPRLVESVAIDAVVAGQRDHQAPGEPNGLELSWTLGSAEQRDALAQLLHRCEPAAANRVEQPFNVLLVEDNHLVRDMFAYGAQKYFRGSVGGIHVHHAADGAAAWEMLGQAPYDLAIVDYYLPVLDGAKLVARMRSEPRLATLPVVAISVGGAEAREATLAAGADLFLDKPLVLKDLFATLERLNAYGAANGATR